MIKLVIFNCILLFFIGVGLVLCKKFVKREKMQNLTLILAALFTILCHYSTFLYLCVTSGSAMDYLRGTPNLLLPIYPCNVVMWGCIIYGFLRNKNSKFALFLADYLFWFGIFSTLVGMFANVDFINNPTLKNYENFKSIFAHATLLFNVLLVWIFGHIKIDLNRVVVNMFFSVVMMYAIGVYCNTVYQALVSVEAANDVNSMFILHSPFPGLDFLTYPIIALVAMVLYFGHFVVFELFAYPKGNRWYNRIKKSWQARKKS